MGTRLDRASWESAALRALEQGGPEAVAIVPLARALGVSRGSFYWHFESRDELLAAVLARWQREHVTDVLDELAAIEDPGRRLRVLLERAMAKTPSILAQLLASDEAAVRAVVGRSARLRIDFLARAYRELGLGRAQARSHALLAYAAYVGIAQVAGSDPELLAPAARRKAFGEFLAERLVPDPSAPPRRRARERR